jgi:ATP/maltotriose-dependent transcriptional regulator MalT
VARAAAAWFSGDPTGASSFAEEAQRVAVSAGLEREARSAVAIQAMVAHSTGEWPSAVHEGLAASLLSPDLSDTLFDGHFCVSEYALTSGDPLDGIRAVSDDLHANAVRSGARRAQVFAATVLGEVALITGALDDAEGRLRGAVKLSREISAYSAEALATMRLAEASHALGKRSQGDALFADALVISRWTPMSSHLLPLAYAALLRATDDPELGGRYVEDGTAYLREQDIVCAYCGMAFRVAATVAAARAGRVEQASMSLAGAEATSGLWRAGPWPAALDEARGELALASGRAVEGREKLVAARDAFADEGRIIDANRVERRLAGVS